MSAPRAEVQAPCSCPWCRSSFSEGAAAERAAVVAWLRQAAENHGCCDHFGDALFDAAKQVEQGAHREPRK